MITSVFRLLSWVLRFFENFTIPYYRSSAFLGFASGVPLLLMGSCLAVRLRMQAEFSDTTIGFISLAALPYALKFPITLLLGKVVDTKVFPRFNNYKGWLLFAQIMFIILCSFFSLMNVGASFIRTFMFAVLINSVAALQSCLTSVYPIHYNMQGLDKNIAAAMQVMGLRFGILVAGTGTLILSQVSGSWEFAYLAVTSTLILGLCGSVPLAVNDKPISNGTEHKNYFRYLKSIVVSFNGGKDVILCLLLMVVYKIGDNMLGPLKNLYYLDVGFSRSEIAVSIKGLGMISAIVGAGIGHYALSSRYFKSSIIAAMLVHALALVSYLLLQFYGSLYLFMGLAFFDSITSGVRGFMLYSLQIRFCGKKDYISQMAILVSLEHISRNIFGAASGYIKDTSGWAGIFIISFLSCVVPLVLLLKIKFVKETQNN